jgi:transglutaminase-like putative cysteine protease
MITYEYKSLEDVLFQIVKIARQGVSYMEKKIPASISTPEQLFYYLSTITDYRDDPPNTELLQSPQSIFENNYWGNPGTGDCDCFTILFISGLLALGVPRSSIEIVLAGNTRNVPKHIYSKVNGVPYDLTNGYSGYERDYAYLQHIPISKLWQ